ncbi:MAG: hypothetical protein LBJ42_01535, partial [Holosporales bacterium]|nr:hypothetical protein [Holosporales bacterium]
ITQHCEYVAFSIPTYGSFLEYKNLFAQSGIDILEHEYATPYTILDIVIKYGTVLSSMLQTYSISFDRALSAAKHFSSVGPHTKKVAEEQGKIAAILATRREAISLNYEMIFIVLKGSPR